MKIIHVAYGPHAYGIGTFLLSLLEAQKELYKKENLAIAFHGKREKAEKFEGIGTPVYFLGRTSARDWRLLFEFKKIFKKYHIINLHTHSPWALLAALWTKKKVIFIFHGALGLKNNWQDYLIKLYYRLFLQRYCQKITFASVSSLERYVSQIGQKLNHQKIKIFPYGVRLENIRALKPKEKVKEELGLSGYFVFGTAARMDPEKRLERLIEAFSFLRKEQRVRLVVAGDGNKDYERFLKRLTMELNVEHMVHFLGFREDIFEIIHSLDFFVLPSHHEPFGLALLEAMRLGVPCAVFRDGGGAVDILGDSGFVVESCQDLAKAILDIKENGTLREKMSMASRERALKFDIEFTARELHSIYSEVMNESNDNLAF